MSVDGGESERIHPRWGVSREQLRRRERMHVDATKPAERVCDDCGHRVTETASGIEVGHSRGRKNPKCPHYEGPHAESSHDEERQSTLSGW